MDTPSSATLLKPRLRLLRRSPSPRSPDSVSDATPQAAPSSGRILFPNTPDDEDEQPTPRMQNRPISSFNGDSSSRNGNITAAPAETPAARLRALLAREPRSPRETPTAPPPAPPSEADSIAGPSRFGSSTSSVARESLKDIFSHALREPGDTPQKGRPRRNSFDGSSMEITPVVDRERGKRRVARQSLSDEEADKPKSYRESNFRSSPAATFDTLRARLMSSQSQLMNQNFSETPYGDSSLASTSQAAPNHRPNVPDVTSYQNQSIDPPAVAADTPQPSFQMSSQFAFQSNLLDQDSEMQRAIGDVINSESEASASAANPVHPTTIAFDSLPASSLRGGDHDSKAEARRATRRVSSSFASSSTDKKINKDHHSHEEERNHLREREWHRPRTQSRTDTPEVHHKQEFHRRLSQEFRSPSHTKSLSHESALSRSNSPRSLRRLERRGSIVSLQSFDDDQSSRPSSIGSQADYRDRISELDQERNYEREREWNKPQPSSRPSSSLSTSSNHSFSHSHSHSHPPRSPSTTPYLTPTLASLQRKTSRTSLRSDSPSSLASSHESLKEREEEQKGEVTHQRERNWNSPRPKWSTSKSPATSHPSQSPGKDEHFLRSSSSLPQLGTSTGHRDVSRGSTNPLQRADTTSSSYTKTPMQQHSSRDRPNSRLAETAIVATHPGPSTSPSPRETQGASSRFGWNFARSPLPPLELDNHVDHPRNGASPGIKSSQIPVRTGMKGFSSIGHATSDMSLTHVVGDEMSSRLDDQGGLTESGELPGYGQIRVVEMSRSQEDIVLASDEESIIDLPPQSTTPKAEPPKILPDEVDTDAETEVLSSPSQGSAQLSAATPIPNKVLLERAIDPSNSEILDFPPKVPPMTSTPPGTPPALLMPDASLSFSLITPPRQPSFGSSILEFRTPSPPHDLPDLPAPPSSSDDDALGADGTPLKVKRSDLTSNSMFLKTPKPPGAWAATPLPPVVRRLSSPTPSFSLESTPPAFTSTPLPRSNSHSGVHSDSETSIVTGAEDGLVTPVATLSRARARSLPPRTPAPPGAWLATPNQPALQSNGPDQSQFGSIGRKKGLLKVRFDVADSEASATEGHPNSPLSAIRLTNPELPSPPAPGVKNASNKVEVSVNGSTAVSTAPPRSTTPDRPTTPISNGLSPRTVRKSPSVRLVDAYGRTRDGDEGDAGSTLHIPNGLADTERDVTMTSSTPQRSLVRIVDAMGRELDDTLQIPDESECIADRSLEGDSSIISEDTPVGHAEVLSRMRKTLKDLAESLSDADRSIDLHLNSGHLEELEEVSKAARSARNQLAQNLHVETAKEHDLSHTPRLPTSTTGLLPVPAVGKSWNKTIIYFGVIVHFILIVAMWRYAHVEARRLFYTTYYDSLYPEFTPVFGNSCFTGTLSNSRSWTMLDSYETIQREGWWSVGKEVLRALRHVRDQVWEQWGDHVYFERPT